MLGSRYLLIDRPLERLVIFPEEGKMGEKYVLEGHKVIKEDDLMTWARRFRKAERRVAKDRIGDVEVSTVFLGLDHSFGSGPPLLFETMVFGGPLDEEMDRYTTWDEAEAGHKAMVKRVQESGEI